MEDLLVSSRDSFDDSGGFKGSADNISNAEGCGNCEIDNDDSREAKERLLDSAEKLFAQNGFKSTTVRQIIKDAGCNIAAVNYHFGGKDNLYLKVFQRRMDYMRERRISAINSVMEKPFPTLEALLRVFAEKFYEPFSEGQEGRYFMSLMMHEMTNPKLGFETFHSEVIVPVESALQKAFVGVCPGLDSDRARGCVLSFIAQLLHLLHNGKKPGSVVYLKSAEISKSISHIIEFTMAGITHFAKGDQ